MTIFLETARKLKLGICLDSLAQETQIIQYLVKSTSEGSKTQKLWISSKGNAPRARQIDTIVDLEFETEDAPMLPFESEIE